MTTSATSGPVSEVQKAREKLQKRIPITRLEEAEEFACRFCPRGQNPIADILVAAAGAGKLDRAFLVLARFYEASWANQGIDVRGDPSLITNQQIFFAVYAMLEIKPPRREDPQPEPRAL